MAKQVPAYIENELRLLNNALASVAKHAQRISDYVDRNTDSMGDDYFHEARLDLPYEFDLSEALDLLVEYVND